MDIQKIGIISKRNAPDHQEYFKRVVQFLQKKGKDVFFDTNCCSFLDEKKCFNKTELLEGMDLVIVMGGDGTILKTARRLSTEKTLILGVNLGNLGFLTECTPEKVFLCLNRIFSGQYEEDVRSLLRVTIYRNGKKMDTFLALNDAVINQGSFARLIQLELEVDKRKVTHFKADGMIVATPSGSTAHSLSAGGPIIHPKIPALVITPICPSSLTMRPIVIPDNRQLKITVKTQRSEETAIIGLTIDGQDMVMLKYGDQIKIRRSSRSLCLVRTRNQYFRNLKRKLNWGGDL